MNKFLAPLIALLIAFPVFGQAVNTRVYTFRDVTAAATWTKPQQVTWYQAETVILNESFATNLTLDVDATNLLMVWEVVARTNSATAYIISTGTVVSAASNHVRWSVGPTNSNLAAGQYRGFVRALETSGTNLVNVGVLAVQDIAVNSSPDSRYYAFQGPLSYAAGGLTNIVIDGTLGSVTGALAYGNSSGGGGTVTAGQWNASVAGASNLALAAYALGSNIAGRTVFTGDVQATSSAGGHLRAVGGSTSMTWGVGGGSAVSFADGASFGGLVTVNGGSPVATGTPLYVGADLGGLSNGVAAVGLVASNALPKSGGTMSGNIGMGDSSITGVSQVVGINESGWGLDFETLQALTTNKVGNLNADLIDGLNATSFLRNLLVTTNGSGNAVTNVAVSVSGTNGTIDIQRGTITGGGGAAQSPITGNVNYAGFNIQDARMVEANALRIGQRSPYTGGNTTDWNTVTNVWDGSQGSWFRSGVRQSAIMSGGTNYMGLNVFGSAIVAGYFNSIDASYCAIGGGADHYILGGLYSIIGGGQAHTGNAAYVTISGGKQNRATGVGATVPGGSTNVASGAGSFAAGRQATASADGAFMWNSVSTNGMTNATAQAFWVNAPGGVRFWVGGTNYIEFVGTNKIQNGVNF